MAFSEQLLAATIRTAEAQWLSLANFWPKQIVLPSLGCFFWHALGCNKSYCRVLVALSGQNVPSLGGFFWQLLVVTNRTAQSWLFLAHVWPQQIVDGFFGPRLAVTNREEHANGAVVSFTACARMDERMNDG